ncbi:MAG: putative metal-binding motif-containing protein [Myxococcota bacterium]|nr:putative metal-binding motif-containing protein [Myxococcota bacterium]
MLRCFSFSFLLACNPSVGKVTLDDLDTDEVNQSGDGILVNDDPDVDNDGDGLTNNEGDCDDLNADVYPSAPELCDDIDNDCDGEVDEEAQDENLYYRDVDNDGYGNNDDWVEACDPPNGFIEIGDDCDDLDAAINPEQEELCDGLDNDCDGVIDNDIEELNLFYQDADGDGYGDPSSTITACLPSEGYVDNSEDCDDSNAYVFPGAEELCDDVQNDCDGSTTATPQSVTFFPADGSAAQNRSGDFGQSGSTTVGEEGSYHFCNGTYEGNIDVTHSVTLVGHDAVLSGIGNGPVIKISNNNIDVNIHSLTIENGVGLSYTNGNYATTSGGISCFALSNLLIEDSTVQNNTGDRGGGLLARFCNVTIRNSNFLNNSAAYGGAMFAIDADVYIEGSLFSTNEASGLGGALHSGLENSPTHTQIYDSTFESNQAAFGGAVSFQYGSGQFDNVVFTGNSSSNSAGSIGLSHSSLSAAHITIEDSTASTMGGAMYIYDSSLALSTSVISSSDAPYGGGMLLGSDTSDGITSSTLNGVEITDNTADHGGGLYIVSGTHTLNDSSISNNTATYQGGGAVMGDLYNDTGAVTAPLVTMNTSTFSNNFADLYGAVKLQYNTSLVCTASSTDTAGFFNNANTQSIGTVFIMDGSSLESQECDFGIAATDNLPFDVSLGKSMGYDNYTYDDNVTFTCVSEVCSH